jgi:hypothetical protein
MIDSNERLVPLTTFGVVISFGCVAVWTDWFVAVDEGLARSSRDSGTASGAVTGGIDDPTVVLFSFSSSATPVMVGVAPGTLSVYLDESCKAAFSCCGERVTDDLKLTHSNVEIRLIDYHFF